jgi:hypothetical protein
VHRASETSRYAIVARFLAALAVVLSSLGAAPALDRDDVDVAVRETNRQTARRTTS